MSNQKPFSRFLFIWAGQFLSILGSGISNFGLSVWIFEKTGAATPFALAFLCSILPSLLFSPLAGSLADRKHRKTIILLTDSLDACLKLLLAVLLFSGAMQVWMVYPFMALSSTLGTFQGPAFSSSIPMLVSEKHLSQAHGLRQLSGAAQSMLAPILAAALYPLLKVQGLLLVDLGSYLFAVITIGFTAIPQPSLKPEDTGSRSLLSTALRDFASAFRYLRKLPRLLSGILVFAVVNFIANLAMILISPMILSNYDTTIYGLSQTVSGFSMIAGGLLASILPNAKNKFAAMYGSLILSGAGIFVAGISPHYAVIFSGMFLFCLLVPYVNAIAMTMIHTAVEPSMLGRVDAAVTVLCQMAMPLSALMAGPLADHVFGPAMLPGGILAKSFVGDLIGTGPGRGCAVIFLLAGLSLMALCAVCLLRSVGKEDYPTLNET